MAAVPALFSVSTRATPTSATPLNAWISTVATEPPAAAAFVSIYICAAVSTHGTISIECGVFNHQTTSLNEDGAAGTQSSTPAS